MFTYIMKLLKLCFAIVLCLAFAYTSGRENPILSKACKSGFFGGFLLGFFFFGEEIEFFLNLSRRCYLFNNKRCHITRMSLDTQVLHHSGNFNSRRTTPTAVFRVSRFYALCVVKYLAD